MVKNIIGIDEVGRGALAGPVVVAAALVRCGGDKIFLKRGLKDSKKLSAAQREFWFDHFKNNKDIFYAVAFVYPRKIEKINISHAANLAALRAFSKLSLGSRLPGFAGALRQGESPRGSSVFLDGGLYLGSRAAQPKYATTMIKADEKIPAVAIASIIAKVTRDRAMTRLAKRHPRYSFEIHKGYGTAIHRRALRQYGPCPAHRATFLKKLTSTK